MAYYIGTDIGGTFTDCVVLDDAGKIVMSKSPSTPANFADGLMNSLLDAASQVGLPLSGLLENARLFPHGCTVATNALINEAGARVGAIITKGFEETLYIMRGSAYCQGLPVEDWRRKPQNERPFDLIPLSDIVGVTERVDRTGEQIVALDEEEVKEAAHFLIVERKCEAIMIGFLWSFINPRHEDRAKEIIERNYPGILVNSSSEVISLIGEYERFSTAALNCYLRPAVERYVNDLNARLFERRLSAPFLIMQAHGGLISWKSAARRAVSMLQSGPAGGVVAGETIANLIGSSNLITADMGGTSFDISLIIEGSPRYTTKSYHSRHVAAAPMIDIESIGAGGGSIAYIDGSVCKVGPHSAGADPGPVCYSKGGKQPTVTDANLVLGYLNPDYFLGGKIKVDIDAARSTIEEQIAAPLGLTVAEAAYGIHRIVNAHMSDAIRFHVLHRGYDPRNFDLLLFGGATPLHAVGIAEDLEVKSIIIPFAGMATALSAFGIANSNVIRTYSASTSLPLISESMETLEAQYSELERRALADLSADGFRNDDVLLKRVANIRYHLQLTEVDVELSGIRLEKAATSRIIERFDRRYAELYGENAGYKDAGRDVISQLVQAIARTPKAGLKEEGQGDCAVVEMVKGKREIYFPDCGYTAADIYDGDRLCAHSAVSGPAVLEMVGTTVLVPMQYCAKLDGYRSIYLHRES